MTNNDTIIVESNKIIDELLNEELLVKLERKNVVNELEINGSQLHKVNNFDRDNITITSKHICNQNDTIDVSVTNTNVIIVYIVIGNIN